MKRTSVLRGLRLIQLKLATGSILCAMFLCSIGRSAENKQPTIPAAAEELVAKAGQAKIEGDTYRGFALLRKALRLAPDYELARWQLGQMNEDGEWVAVEEAQRRAASNPKQAQYRELRNTFGESPEGQLELARWARKNDLDDEARFHWASVLSVDPTNEEAMKVLDLRWYDGQLLTREQITRQKAELREAKQASKRWGPTIKKWRGAISGDDGAAREKALSEIQSIEDIEAVQPLEAITLGTDDEDAFEECRQLTLALLEALSKMPAQAATESLVRHAVLSPVDAGRTKAIKELKRRPPHDFIPLLLGGLGMPIESSFNVHTAADGAIHYRHSLYREGPQSDWAIDAKYATMQHIWPGRRFIYRVRTNEIEEQTGYKDFGAQVARTANRSGRQYINTAVATETQVRNTNQYTAALNSRIMPVLAAVSGKNFDSPKLWWDWWTDHNEYYASDHPVERQYFTDTDHYYYGQPYDTMSYNMSCFAKGTTVWTKTGQRPIEALELGDLVLAQNVHTGELAYKPIIGRTVRPPSEILDLAVEGGEIRTTLGHPFWVAGIGWRMAKELADGAILHGVTGAPRLTSIKKAEMEEAHNLVVADFNTYFVGASGVLVHDNTPRTPTRATLPGLIEK